MSDDERTYDFIELGPNGHRAITWGHSGHTSGYIRKLDDPRLTNELREGGMILDKTTVEDKAFFSEVFSGPMLSPDLDIDDNDRCPMPSDVLLSGLQDGFKMLAELRASDDSFRGLDKVGAGVFVRRWLRLGARVFVKQDGALKQLTDPAEIMAALPRLVHGESHFWGKVTVWKFADRFEVRWGGNGWYPKEYKFKTERAARNKASRLAWKAYDTNEMKDVYRADACPSIERC